jgi:hypothetical protein
MFVRFFQDIIRHELSAFRLCKPLANSFAGLLIKRRVGGVSRLAFAHDLQDSPLELEMHGAMRLCTHASAAP